MKWLKARIKKIRIIRLIYNFLKPYFRERFAIIQGHKIFINRKDYRSCEHLLEGIYEPEETEIVKREVGKGDIVVDLGANVGYYTLLLANLVGKDGRVYAFEPDPTNFALLKKNVKVNNYSNVILERKGVLDKTGKSELWLRSDVNKAGHRIVPIDKSIHHSKPIEIDVVSLDDYFKDQKIDFVKMDIEGSETMALKGMKNILKGNVKILIEGNMDSEYIKELHNFKIYKINNDNLFCIKE